MKIKISKNKTQISGNLYAFIYKFFSRYILYIEWNSFELMNFHSCKNYFLWNKNQQQIDGNILFSVPMLNKFHWRFYVDRSLFEVQDGRNIYAVSLYTTFYNTSIIQLLLRFDFTSTLCIWYYNNSYVWDLGL